MGKLLSRKLRATTDTHLTYWCQGCNDLHQIRTGKNGWTWNGDAEKPVFNPSVLVTYDAHPDAKEEFKEWRLPRRCHTFVGCNGAQPGQVIFLSDCSHELAGTVQDFPDLPDWMLEVYQRSKT